MNFVRLIDATINWAGAPSSELSQPWVGNLAVFNGIVHAYINYRYYLDKIKYPTPSGAMKVASLNVMNHKYRGIFRTALALHISSGLVSHLGSSASILLRELHPRVSSWLAVLSSAAETLVHGPSALYLTPHVYGDKGVTVFYYGLVSTLLCLSGASALIESVRRLQANENASEKLPRSELRRMNTTISVFLYVRLFPLVRGVHGILRPNKYALATLVAGTSMLPVAWDRKLFPMSFWALTLFNWRTLIQTSNSIHKHGIDATAVLQDTFTKV